MNVVFVPDYRGGNPYQRLLAQGLERLGIGVHVSGGMPARALLSARLRLGSVDVLHVHWPEAYVTHRLAPVAAVRAARFLAEVAAARRMGVKVVWTVHNLAAHEPSSPLVERLALGRFARLAQAFIVHAPSAAEAFASAYGLSPQDRERVSVIEHGNYLDVYPATTTREEARAQLGIEPGKKVLLFFGHVRRYKGVLELIAAFRRLRRDDVTLIVAGQPHHRAIRGEVLRACEGDRRIRTDLRRIADDEVQRFMLAADAVVLPFQSVLTSGSAVLAMSFGRAVVTPRLGCLPETLAEHGGVLYDPAAPDALHDALTRALESDLEAMGARNLQRARELSWDVVAERTARVYREAR